MCTEADPQPGAQHSPARSSGEPAAANATEEARLDLPSVERALSGTVFAGKLHHFASIDSTQTRALADAQANRPAGQVYVADEQTAGRGRGGHTWHSEPGSGLYVTVLARPSLHASQAAGLSLATGLAAQSAIGRVAGLRVDLRWPNDLVTLGPGSRKLGGILIESAVLGSGRLRYAAIGIGLNLNQTVMPAELQAQSTSLRMLLGGTVSRQATLIALLQELQQELAEIERDPQSVFERFAANSTFVRGKPVWVEEDEGYTGVTDGFSEAGLLRVVCNGSGVRLVRHGGVRELPSSAKNENA